MKYPSFVEETTTTSGTGNLTLAGATAGHRTLAAAVTAGHMANNDYVPYYLYESASLWERGIGQWTGSAFVRSVVLENDDGTTSAITLTGGGATLRLSALPPVLLEDRKCHMYNGATESIAANSAETISWDHESTDTDSSWSSGDATKIYVPSWCSIAKIRASIYQNTASLGPVRLRILKPQPLAVSHVDQAGTSILNGTVDTGVIEVTPGGYFQLEVKNDNGTQLDIDAYNLEMLAIWMG